MTSLFQTHCLYNFCHALYQTLLFTFDKEYGIILWFRYKLLFFFFFSVYKFRKKYIAAYIALKVMQSTRFLYYIHIGATILATSFIQTLISVLVTMCRRQNITLFERFHKELLLNDFLNLFQGICNFYAPLPSILHSEQPILHVFTTYDCSALMPLCSLSFPET